jgi:hypothetical protein
VPQNSHRQSKLSNNKNPHSFTREVTALWSSDPRSQVTELKMTHMPQQELETIGNETLKQCKKKGGEMKQKNSGDDAGKIPSV